MPRRRGPSALGHARIPFAGFRPDHRAGSSWPQSTRIAAKGCWWTRDLDGYVSRHEAEAEAARVRTLAPHRRLTD
jgi:hypothetical protein